MRAILVLVLLASLLASAPSAQAQYGEPDQVFFIGSCTAIFDVHHHAVMRQVDKQTGDGFYDLPLVVASGRVRIDPKWADTLVLVWSNAEKQAVTLRQLLCPGAPGWRVWMPEASR